ncbi:unnamed protein product [Orchesella dallaii]|uniref:RING-type E3 ubiquitin transferase n=1 Tax=Orchesella dallaii TaxID=48710 RepID=A0ABP1RR13_9HEXA
MFQKIAVLNPSKMTTIIELLKCPVCFEIPSESVFQCKYGHTFCKQCSVYLKTCPQCRIQLGHEKIRNRTLEQLLDVMDFNCPNKELGCVKVLKRDEITNHLKYCRYEPFYFCKLIGFQSCSYNCDTKERAQNLLSHLNEAHPEILESLEYLSASTFSMMYENFYTKIHSLEKGCFSIWTPHLVKLKNTKEIYADVEKQAAGDEEMVLLFLCQVSEATKNVAWICLCLTDSFKRTGNKKSISTQPGILVEYRIKGKRFDNVDLFQK